MILSLMLRSLARGKARFACAAAGVAAATGAVVFVFSLAATNSAQAPALARRAAVPWTAWAFGEAENADLSLPLVQLTIDYRPGGRVLQGPPMRAVLAEAPAENPWACAPLVEGRWVDPAAASNELVCTRGTLRRFGRGEPPPLGSPIKFVGRKGTMTATLVGLLDEARLPPGWPGAFASGAAFAALSEEPHGTLSLWKQPAASRKPQTAGAETLTPESETVVNGFKSDEGRRMDYARPLLFAAAILTALALLVHSLLLAVEANRRPVALLRTVGLTRGGVARLVAAEALFAVAVGWALGCAAALGALALYIGAAPDAFPTGPAVAWRSLGRTGLAAVAVALLSLAFALRPALRVRPLDALGARPRPRRHGMAVAFAFGFGAFVAVEVWGASLMRAFVPSPEWPDAIVSILPGGVDPVERTKLDGLPGVRRLSELYPLQLAFEPEIPLPMRGGPAASAAAGGRGGPPRPMLRNALFLGAEWLPRFRFLEGTWEEASAAVMDGGACVIAEMVARAHGLHKGDVLRVASGGGRGGPKRIHEVPIAGVVDLNWHMVTSRGLVRGLNGAPGATDGPAFVSLDTANALDPRPFLASVPMTHLWVEYEPAYLAEKGVFPAGRQVEKEIADALGNPVESTVRLHARDEIADGTLAHGSDLIGQTARVPFVFLAILSLGFVAMLVADADAARRELAVLRAVGATRAQLAARLARGAAQTALAGVLIGIPCGAAAGWLFSLKTGSIWPGLPPHFAFPLRVIAEGAVGSLCFALLVAVPTALLVVARAIRAGEAR